MDIFAPLCRINSFRFQQRKCEILKTSKLYERKLAVVRRVWQDIGNNYTWNIITEGTGILPCFGGKWEEERRLSLVAAVYGGLHFRFVNSGKVFTSKDSFEVEQKTKFLRGAPNLFGHISVIVQIFCQRDCN